MTRNHKTQRINHRREAILADSLRLPLRATLVPLSWLGMPLRSLLSASADEWQE